MGAYEGVRAMFVRARRRRGVPILVTASAATQLAHDRRPPLSAQKNIELEVENMEPMRRAESRADAILAVMDAMLSCGGVRAVLVRTRQGRGIRKLLVHILRTVASFCSSFNGKSRSPW